MTKQQQEKPAGGFSRRGVAKDAPVQADGLHRGMVLYHRFIFLCFAAAFSYFPGSSVSLRSGPPDCKRKLPVKFILPEVRNTGFTDYFRLR